MSRLGHLVQILDIVFSALSTIFFFDMARRAQRFSPERRSLIFTSMRVYKIQYVCSALSFLAFMFYIVRVFVK